MLCMKSKDVTHGFCQKGQAAIPKKCLLPKTRFHGIRMENERAPAIGTDSCDSCFGGFMVQ